MPSDLREGDLVRLKSGGLAMTVINPQGAAGEVWCLWTTGEIAMRDAFPANALERIAAPPSR
jgi:uncharacterized protein YodC (DUF2158 family)